LKNITQKLLRESEDDPKSHIYTHNDHKWNNNRVRKSNKHYKNKKTKLQHLANLNNRVSRVHFAKKKTIKIYVKSKKAKQKLSYIVKKYHP
jgi:hypothetical protein